jgi:hypothetical protein
MKRPLAPVPQLARTKLRICSAAELVPSVAAQEWNVEQSSPLRSQPHLLSKCGSRSSAQVACKAFHPHSLGERTSKLGRTICIVRRAQSRTNSGHPTVKRTSELGRSIIGSRASAQVACGAFNPPHFKGREKRASLEGPFIYGRCSLDGRTSTIAGVIHPVPLG